MKPELNLDFPMRERHREAFDLAVKLLRDGTSFLEVEDALAEGCFALTVSAAMVAAEARRWLTNFQTILFENAVIAFQNGDSDFEVAKQIQASGCHPYEAGIIAARAKKAAGLVDAEPPKPEETKPKELVEAEALLERLRRQSIEDYAKVNPKWAAEVEAENAAIREHAAQLEAKRNAQQVVESPEKDAFVRILSRWNNDVEPKP